MDPVSLAFIVIGATLIALGVWRARGPWLRSQELRAHRANLERYESWRGGRPAVPERGPDSAELMLFELRRQVRLWLAVLGIGVLFVIAGFWLG